MKINNQKILTLGRFPAACCRELQLYSWRKLQSRRSAFTAHGFDRPFVWRSDYAFFGNDGRHIF